MPPRQFLSSSPPTRPAKSSDNKVTDDNLRTQASLLQGKRRDNVEVMSSTPNPLGATKPAVQATRPSSGTRNASSRDSKAKGATNGKAPRVQPAQTQLTRLGFHVPSSSPPLPPSVIPVTKSRGPGYYSAEAPRTRRPESPQTQSSPQTPNKRVHFSESSKKNDNDSYYTPEHQDRLVSRATASPGTPKKTSSLARQTTASPGTPKIETKNPGKLVVTMDEVQIYIAYSRTYKELEAKMPKNPPMKVKVTIPLIFLEPRQCAARGSSS